MKVLQFLQKNWEKTVLMKYKRILRKNMQNSWMIIFAKNQENSWKLSCRKNRISNLIKKI